MSFSVTASEVGVAGSTALTRANRMNNRAMEQLSTGRRITSAKDDAAGLGVSGNLENQHRGTRVAMRHVEDGMSMLAVAEGAASTVSDIVQRMRELAVQSSSGALNTTERAYLQDEFAQLESEITDIGQRTVFNTTKLVDGNLPSLDVQVGANNSQADRITIDFVDLSLSAILGGTHDISSSTGAQDSLADIDTAIARLSQARSTLGAGMNRLSTVIESNERYSMSMIAAESKITDADYARETAEMAKAQIMMQSNMASRTQARTSAQTVMSLLG
jgi:flagellin